MNYYDPKGDSLEEDPVFQPPEALTFDDVLMVPQYSDIMSRRDVDTTSWLTPDIKLKLPVVSANMDSVTEAEMAKKVALGTYMDGGGIGFIHRFNSIEQETAEVEKVKRYRSYIIEDPYTVLATERIADAEETMDDKGIGGLLVVDKDSGELTGIVTRRDIYSEPRDRSVSEVMTPRDSMILADYEEMKELSKVEKAKALMHEAKVEKLPLIDSKGIPVGLIVMKDIRKLEDYPNASINERGNLLVGAAIGTVGDYMERAESLVAAGVDVLVSDVAHAHHESVRVSIGELKKRFPDIPIVGGTIATAEGFRFLAESGADSVAVGVGSGCFAAGTRVLMGNGTYKNIEDIQVGDYVINKNGKAVRVNKAWMTGHKKVNKLRHTQNAKPTYVTPDHRYWSADYEEVPDYVQTSEGYVAAISHAKAKTDWKPISDFDKTVALLPEQIDYRWEEDFTIDLKDYSQKEKDLENYTQEIKPNYDLGYIFGTFLGDGCSFYTFKSKQIQNYIGRVSWYFGAEENEITEKLMTAVERTFGKSTTLTKKKNLNMVHLYSKQWAKFFKDFGKKTEKALPEKFLINNKEYLQGIFDGLIDSDGHFEKQVIEGNHRITLTNTSQSIIELFAVITHKLYGSFPSQAHREGTEGNLKGCNPENLSPVFTARLDSGYKRRLTDDYQIVKVCENIETDIIVPVYDIEVDCPTHSFIADNAIVHNSICSTRLVAGHGMPQLQALYESYRVQQDEYPNISIIADGGIRKPADFDKAMVFADLVKMGSMLAGTPESPGEVTRNDKGQDIKIYRGMASKEAFEAKLEAEGVTDRMKRSANYTPEGIQVEIPTKPPVEQLLSQFAGGLRSAMSYAGARNLDEYKDKARFTKISSAGLAESDTHIRHQR